MINLYLGVFPFLYMQFDREMLMLLFVDVVPNYHCFHEVQDYVIYRWYLSSIYVISADDSSGNVPNIVPVYWILVPTRVMHGYPIRRLPVPVPETADHGAGTGREMRARVRVRILNFHVLT